MERCPTLGSKFLLASLVGCPRCQKCSAVKSWITEVQLMRWLAEQSSASDLIFAFHVTPQKPWEGWIVRSSEGVSCPVCEYGQVTQGKYTTREQLSMYTLREEVWLQGCFTAGGCSSEGTTVSKYQRESKTRVTIWTPFKTQRHRGRGYTILFTLTHQQRLGLQQLNACTTGEDIRPDLRIKAIKKKVNLFLCSRLRGGKQ